MTDIERFEARFEAWIQARADVAVRPTDSAAIARAAIGVAGGRRQGRASFGQHSNMPLIRGLLIALLVALLAGAAVLVGSQLLKPSPAPSNLGRFTTTGSMSGDDERMSPTATLLKDGRVLVIGGYGSAGMAEIWDPATGAFRSAGSLPEARVGHTATLLQDGRVLVVGGRTTDAEGGVLPVGTAEVWDPAMGSFGPTGSPAQLREPHTATLQPDGRVLVVGYGAGGGGQADSAELWDPATGSFTQTASLPADPYFSSGTRLLDGRLLITDGVIPRVWDPTSGTSSLAGSLADPRIHPTATLLQDGRVLVAGGMGPCIPASGSRTASVETASGCTSPRLASAEIWDPATGLFTLTGPMNSARSEHAATLLLDGRVLIVGGAHLTSAELFQLQ